MFSTTLRTLCAQRRDRGCNAAVRWRTLVRAENHARIFLEHSPRIRRFSCCKLEHCSQMSGFHNDWEHRKLRARNAAIRTRHDLRWPINTLNSAPSDRRECTLAAAAPPAQSLRARENLSRNTTAPQRRATELDSLPLLLTAHDHDHRQVQLQQRRSKQHTGLALCSPIHPQSASPLLSSELQRCRCAKANSSERRQRQ